MTKGQMEAKISEAFSQFEIEHMGRGPKQIKSYILDSMIIVRMLGFFSPSEQKLAESQQGVELIKKLRTMLFEGARPVIEKLITTITATNIVSIHSDVSTKSGEKIILITLDENLEDRFCNK